MANTDPWTFKRPQRDAHVKLFRDKEQDAEVELSLRKLDSAEASYAHGLVQEYMKEYMTGDEAEGIPPKPLPVLGGEPIMLSQPLFYTCCNLWTMQHPTKKYTVQQFLAMSVAFSEWPAIIGFMNEVQVSTKLPNGCGVPTETPSELQSNSTEGIPNLTLELTPS